MRSWRRWIPAGIFATGIVLIQTVARQRPMSLTTPLSSMPAELDGLVGRDVPMSSEEQRVAGMSSYLSRIYGSDSSTAFSLYVGYYESQTQGNTIHSPKNCLPGAGWEPMATSEILVTTEDGTVPVNRYVIAKKNQRAIVYYWYQGRGRVAANEYVVKWHLLLDASIRRRTDEALVRIVVPIRTTEQDAEAVATRVAKTLVPAVAQILPS